MNIEIALITKILETKDINKAINSKVGKSITLNTDIWEFIQDHYLKYRTVPSISLVEEKFTDFVPEHVDESLEFLIDELHKNYIKYKLADILTESARSLNDDPRETLYFLFSKIATLSHQTDTVKDVDLSSDYYRRVESLRTRLGLSEQGNQILGIPSGIPQIDVLYGGWQKGDFVVLMGWTASSKTWLATYFAVNAWKQGYRPLYFSLEMDDLQLGYRVDTIIGEGLLSNTSLINARNIDADTYELWSKSMYEGKHPFFVVTNEGLDEVTQLTVQAKIEQYKPDMVICDYHSLFDDAKRGRSETERHRNLSKDFKRLAVRYGIPIIDIVAVTMEEGHETRPPELNEVAWSRQLSYDADLVLSLLKNGQTVTVEAKKSRRSDLFAFKAVWDFDRGKLMVQDW